MGQPLRAGPLAPGATAPPGHGTTAAAAPPTVRPGISYSHFRIGNRNVKSILADGPLVWVGTSGGVIRYDTTTDDYRLFDVRSGLLSNGVFHLSKLGGRLAVGTYGGGLSLLDTTTEQWENFNIQHGLGDAFVYDMVETPGGDLWLATWSGANRVRGGKLKDRASWDLYTVENTAGGLPNDWVYGLANGKNGEVWLATEGGLARFVDDKWTHWTHKEGLGAPYEQVRDQIQYTRDPAKESSHHARQKAEQGLGQVDVAYNPNYIVSLLVDDDGVVWCGTWGGGLGRFDGTTWTNFTVDDGLPGNHVFMLSRDPQGRLWIGTSKGLAVRDGDRFTTFTTADGLFADNVFSMSRDDQGRLWIGSFGGVARVSGLDKAL
ncbi:MAG: regulator [Ectothiorhodospiraceae bacterium]|nr:regulator [Chromatiales bacterium]MCP5154582.1 regulator [Ectothiorhodospiraceae bacterium]